jgi:hypothetical protein
VTKKQKILLGVSIAVLVGGAVLVYFLRKKKPQTKDIKKILVAEPNVKDTNAYKILERELNNAKDILEGYEKDGKVLLDTAKGLKSSEDGTKSVFFMITKQMPSIQKGIQNDVNLNDAQKKELIKIYNSYFSEFLPSYFDTSVYSIDKDWYKEMLSKVKFSLDYYKL